MAGINAGELVLFEMMLLDTLRCIDFFNLHMIYFPLPFLALNSFSCDIKIAPQVFFWFILTYHVFSVSIHFQLFSKWVSADPLIISFER